MYADWPDLPGYELTELLGTGGMASVYLANQIALGRKVAIKVMAQKRHLSPQELARFEREVKLLASLDHPHIVSVFEVGRTADGRLYYVMPHMPGGDLTSIGITGNEVAIAEVLDKILSALEYAHARGVVHRDLKPGNILFDALGQPRLADFGVAKPSDEKATRLTSEGMVVGSASYMAPEQARGEAVDGRADLYSLGVTAFELLTGRPPFRGPDSVAVLAQHISAPVPILPRRFRHWQPFLQKALAKDPKQRFASATEMRKALKAVRAARRRRSSWLRSAAWLAVFGLVVAGAVYFESMRREETTEAPLAPSATPVAAKKDDDVADEDEWDQTEPEDGEALLPTAVPEERVLRDPRLALLARAREQLTAGAIISPPGENATALALEVLRYWPEDADAAMLLIEIVTTIATRAERALAEGDRAALRSALEEARQYAALRGEEGSRFLAGLAEQLRAQPRKGLRPAELAAVLREFGMAPTASADAPRGAPGGERTPPPREESIARAAAETPRPAPAPPPPPPIEPPLPPPPEPFVWVPTRLSYDHASSLSLRPIGALPEPVSLADFTAYAEATGQSLPSCPEDTPSLGAPDPVVCVTAADAEAYAAWLGSRLNRKLRLPTADELQHIVLYQVAGLKQRLLVREWTLDCAEGSPSCRERLVIVPAADPLYWPLRLQPRDTEKPYRDLGFRLVLAE